RNDGSVKPTLGEFLNELRGQRLAHVNVEFGAHAREIRDDGRQQIRRNSRDHADAQPTRKAVSGRAREISQLVDRAQDVAYAEGGLFPDLGQSRLSCASLDEHGAESLFQFFDLHRQRGLRDSTSGRPAPEVALTSQCIEIAKLSEGYFRHQNV